MSRRQPALRHSSAPAPDQLAPEEVARRLDTSELPHDVRRHHVKLHAADSGHIAELEEVLIRSGVLPYIRRRFKPKGGSTSKLPDESLLMGALYVAGEWNSYLRTELTGFFAGLKPQDAVDWGIQPLDGLREPITYNTVRKRADLIEKALCEGWVDETDGTVCDLQWLFDSLIAASVPDEVTWRTASVASDTTDYQSWSQPPHARRVVEAAVAEGDIAELNKTIRLRRGAKRRGFKRTNGLIGQRRSDGGIILSRTPGASWGHRNAASGHAEDIFFGSHVTIAVAVKYRKVTGSQKKAKFGPRMPPYIVAVDSSPAGVNPADAGIRTFVRARKLCTHTDDAVVDRGFSQLRDTFNRELHKMGVHVTMDHRSDWLKTARPVKLGPSGYPAIVHAGTILHACTPKKWRVPSEGLTEEELENFYVYRERFTLTVNRHFPNGDKQFESPIHRGDFTIGPAESPASTGRALYPKPDDFDTLFPGIPKELLRQPYIMVTAEELDDYQQPHFGTPPQNQSYGRRLPSENGFAILKENNGLTNKTCRAANDGARAISVIARIVRTNLNLTHKQRQEAQEAEQAAKKSRRTHNATQPKTYEPRQPDDPDPATSPETDTGESDASAPRAPP